MYTAGRPRAMATLQTSARGAFPSVMLRKFLPALLFALLLLGLAPAASAVGEDIVAVYSARLSRQDHYASDGVPLESPAAVIRQDRANYHKFHRPDTEDDGDSFFDSAEHRALLERALERGHTPRTAYRAIMQGTPYITVTVYRDRDGYYVDVKIAGE